MDKQDLAADGVAVRLATKEYSSVSRWSVNAGGPDHLTVEALTAPLDFKAYQVTRRLNELFPDRAVLQAEPYSFQLPQYAAAGLCGLAIRPDSFYHSVISFRGLGEGLGEDPKQVWYAAEWQGHHLQVLQMSWYVESCEGEYNWIIAETDAIARQFYLAVCEWNAEVRGEVLVFDNGYWQKDERLFYAIKNATFENLILPARLKGEIQEDFAQFFASRDMYERYRIPWKRGVLLIGPPGNGTTHTVKALLNWLDAPCLYVKSFRARYRTPQENIQEVFRRARQTTPCILVLEDLDSLIDSKNRSFFLNELDGFAANTGIVVLATTNHPERLDPALLNRPSRFDRKYHFDLPAEPERRAYIELWNGAVEPDLHLSPEAVAATVEATEGFSFAYLKELFLSSMMRWISQSGQTSMEAVIAEQCDMLREQMHAMDEVAPPDTDPNESDEED